jgi:hypothetical protein
LLPIPLSIHWQHKTESIQVRKSDFKATYANYSMESVNDALSSTQTN